MWEEAGHVMVTWSEDTFSEEEEGAGPVTLQYAIGMYVRGRETLQYAIGMLGGGRQYLIAESWEAL